MAYVSTSSEFFKAIKRELYGYIEQRQQEAREADKEFTRPMISDGAIQVLIEVIKKRRAGNEAAAVPTVMGKVSHSTAAFLNQFLEAALKDPEGFVKTNITLPKREQESFLHDLKSMLKVPPARRQALGEAFRNLLPKVDGLRLRKKLEEALETKDQRTLNEFIEFADVEEDGASDTEG